MEVTRVTNKNQIVLEYLKQCPGIKHLFFEYGERSDDAIHLLTSSVEKATRTEYIDGSQPKRLDYTIVWHKALSYMPVMSEPGTPDPAVAELDDVQSIIEWINAQERAHNYPEFGINCPVDRVHCLNDVPQLAGIDTRYNPPLARYSFTVRFEYIDMTHCVFN